MARETKAERDVRQDAELTQFVRVLRDAGNVVEEEVLFDCRAADSSQSPPIPRKWKFDVAMPLCPTYRPGMLGRRMENIAIEVEGVGLSHMGRKGWKRDIEKSGEAFAQWWTVLRVTRQDIKDGTALDLLARRGVRVSRSTTFPVEG